MSTLDEAKTLLSERLLGRSGVHAVGLRRRDDAVCVYVSPDVPESTVAALVREAGREVMPHHVLVVREAPAQLASSGTHRG